MESGTDSLTVACPGCKARTGEPCRNHFSGDRTIPHRARETALAATIQPVPRPRGEITKDQMTRWIRAENKVDDAKDELRRVTVAILAEGASFSEVSKATGLSTNTF